MVYVIGPPIGLCSELGPRREVARGRMEKSLIRFSYDATLKSNIACLFSSEETFFFNLQR